MLLHELGVVGVARLVPLRVSGRTCDSFSQGAGKFCP